MKNNDQIDTNARNYSINFFFLIYMKLKSLENSGFYYSIKIKQKSIPWKKNSYPLICLLFAKKRYIIILAVSTVTLVTVAECTQTRNVDFSSHSIHYYLTLHLTNIVYLLTLTNNWLFKPQTCMQRISRLV